MKKILMDDLIKIFNEIHKNKYDYSLSEYQNLDTKIKIICHEHGIFMQTPSNHRSGKGCRQCYLDGISKLYFLIFLERAPKIHDNKYDYSNVIYINKNSKIEIKCPIHGIFLQRPAVHLHGFGCPQCSGLKKSNTEDFIEKANLIHKNIYDYSLVEYKNSRSKIKIICKEHGIFEQTANSHLNGRGCSDCLYKGQQLTGASLKKLLPNVEIISQFSFRYKNKLFKADYFITHDNKKYIIEYDGAQHFMPIRFGNMSQENAEKQFEKQKMRDIFLKEYCDGNNICYISIDSRKISFSQIENYLQGKLIIAGDLVIKEKYDCFY